VAQNQARAGGSALDARTVRRGGYAVSQWIRKQVEETFGWMKTVGALRRTRYRGRAPVQMHAYLTAAACNLLKIANLSPAPRDHPSVNRAPGRKPPQSCGLRR
jgi:hypothetical protein